MSSDPFARLRFYREASPEQRAEMIRDYYASQRKADRASRAAAYDLFRGPGAYDAMRAEIEAMPIPQPTSTAWPYSPGDDRSIRRG